MNTRRIGHTLLALALLAATPLPGWLAAARGATRYVAHAGQTPAAPYTSWETAASNIQDAVDAAVAGDTVLVGSGVYDQGGVANYPSGTVLTNRVAVHKAITVRSANDDPAATIIKGRWHSETNRYGPAAVRCVYLANGASLMGFTLTNGATTLTGSGSRDKDVAGGVCSVSVNNLVSNCWILGNSAWGEGGGARYGTFHDCTFAGNTSLASYGGAAREARLYNCTVVSNNAFYGGGTSNGSVSNSLIAFNTSRYGGVCGGSLIDCTIAGNSGGDGGGVRDATTVRNCIIKNNSGTGGGKNCTFYNCIIKNNSGSGGENCTFYNCVLMGNSSRGANASTLHNCTVVGNRSGSSGGGVSGGKAFNTIVCFNAADSGGQNWNAGTPTAFTNCCTYPAVAGWAEGNITNDPSFVASGSGYGLAHVPGDYHLQRRSPCIDAGTNMSWITASTLDLDGAPRIRNGVVDMGAYEFVDLTPRGTMFFVR